MSGRCPKGHSVKWKYWEIELNHNSIKDYAVVIIRVSCRRCKITHVYTITGQIKEAIFRHENYD